MTKTYLALSGHRMTVEENHRGQIVYANAWHADDCPCRTSQECEPLPDF